MQIMQQVPDGWSADKLQAFNDLCSACLSYYLFTQSASVIGLNKNQAAAATSAVAGLITNSLFPAFVNTP